MLKAGLQLAWVTASRCSDLQPITVGHLRYLQAGLWDITFPKHKASNTPVTDRSELPTELHNALTVLIHDKPDSHRPFAEFTAAKVAKLLKEVDKKYSGHSVKRGSLIELVLAGVPLEQVRVKAKHKTITQLYDYLPGGLIAECHGTVHCSKTLNQILEAVSGPQRPLPARASH